jgi:hypothetical protein
MVSIPTKSPGEAIVVWTPTTTTCAMTHANTLDQSSSNPSIQMVKTKRKALDQDGLLANKAACIEEPEPFRTFAPLFNKSPTPFEP